MPENNIADIIFYPHLYDIHWARDLNRFLSGKFTTLLEPQYAPWLKSRSLNHAYMAQLLPLLRQRPQSRLLLANAVDYSPDFAQYGYVSEIYAFVHSRHILGESEPDAKRQLYEKNMLDMIDRLFVSTECFERAIRRFLGFSFDDKIKVTGLPIFEPAQPPSGKGGILYPHRLSAMKGVEELYCLPEDILQRLVVCTPKFAPQSVAKLRGLGVTVLANPSWSQYVEASLNCGLVLSTSRYESFSYSILENVMRGLMPVAPDSPTTCYADLLSPECLYINFDDLVDKLRYYTKHIKFRMAIVLGLQEKLAERFGTDTFWQLLMEGLG